MQFGVAQHSHREPVYKRGLKLNRPKWKTGYTGRYPNVQMTLLLPILNYKATFDLHLSLPGKTSSNHLENKIQFKYEAFQHFDLCFVPEPCGSHPSRPIDRPQGPSDPNETLHRRSLRVPLSHWPGSHGLQSNSP